MFWENRPSIFAFFIFVNMFPETHGFVAMPVTSCIKNTCSNLSLYNYWRETTLFVLVTSTATKPWLSENILPNIKNMWKWMVQFHRKFENCGVKIVRVNSILITKSVYSQLFTLILFGVGGSLWCWHCSSQAPTCINCI